MPSLASKIFWHVSLFSEFACSSFFFHIYGFFINAQRKKRGERRREKIVVLFFIFIYLFFCRLQKRRFCVCVCVCLFFFFIFWVFVVLWRKKLQTGEFKLSFPEKDRSVENDIFCLYFMRDDPQTTINNASLPPPPHNHIQYPTHNIFQKKTRGGFKLPDTGNQKKNKFFILLKKKETSGNCVCSWQSGTVLHSSSTDRCSATWFFTGWSRGTNELQIA